MKPDKSSEQLSQSLLSKKSVISSENKKNKKDLKQIKKYQKMCNRRGVKSTDYYSEIYPKVKKT